MKLRKCYQSDYPFIHDLYWEVMKEHVAKVITWNDSEQDIWFKETFSLKDRFVVHHEGRDVGTIKFCERQLDFFLEDIELCKNAQGKGLGKELIEDVLKSAEINKKPVRLQVLKSNQALHLYERLGFVVEIETLHHYKMIHSSQP